MFDMDPFGGKKVPCTKMPQKLEKLNNPILGLLRPRGVLNNPPLFLSLDKLGFYFRKFCIQDYEFLEWTF